MKLYRNRKLKEALLKSGVPFSDNPVIFKESVRNTIFNNDEIKAVADDYLNGTDNSQLAKSIVRIKERWIEGLTKTDDMFIIANFILSALTKQSRRSYFVGGVNRDILAGKEPKDLDIVTDIPIDKIPGLLGDDFNYKFVGEHFGVIMVEKDKFTFEIANYRKDLDHNGVGATNVDLGTFDDDWQRRDFTFNALYSNPITGQLIDPSQKGIDDALSKKIRFVGNADERIHEDAIRLLRFYKFIKKGFTPTKGTLSSIRKNFYRLCEAHPERIREHIELLSGLKD